MAPAGSKLTPHEVIGVEVGASVAEVRKAYLAQARKYHPDKQGPDATPEQLEAAARQFIALHAAWEDLVKYGFGANDQEAERGDGIDWEQREAVLSEALDFVESQIDLLHTALYSYDKTVKTAAKKKGRKGVKEDLKKGIPLPQPKAPAADTAKAKPSTVQSILDDDLGFLRRLSASAWSTRYTLIEEHGEARGMLSRLAVKKAAKKARDEAAAASAAAAPAGPAAAAETAKETQPCIENRPYFSADLRRILGECVQDLSSYTHSWCH